MVNTAATPPNSEVEPWPADGLERVESCPLCAARSRTILFSGLSDRVFRCAKGLWSLYRCDGCTACYLDPRPNAATIGEAYASYYTHKGADESEKPPQGIRSLKKILENSYLNERYGYDLNPKIMFSAILLLFSPLHRRILDRNVRMLKVGAAEPKLLDLGCGNGVFLRQMKKLGWDSYGIDPDEEAVKTARSYSLDIKHGLLDDDTYPEATFDAITMTHVVEHLHDPVKVLKQCFRILKPGGTLFHLTPNIDSIGRHMFGFDWRGLEPPRHLVIFNFRSLELACRKAGFTVEVSVGTPMAKAIFTPSYLLAQGKDPINDPWKFGSKEQVAYKMANIRSVVQKTCSEEIMIVARRPS